MQTTSNIPPLPGSRASLSTDEQIDKLSDTAHQTVDRVADTIGTVSQRLSDTGEQLRSTGERWTSSSRDTIVRHPIASLATAVVAGVLISRLTSRHH